LIVGAKIVQSSNSINIRRVLQFMWHFNCLS